jgi:hypothetical protein
MTDNITLPRAAEQARNFLHHLREWDVLSIPNSDGAFWCREIDAALAALDAALAEPPAKPEPATDEQIVKAGGECAVVDNEYLLDFRDGFRAAERFHNITKEDGK